MRFALSLTSAAFFCAAAMAADPPWSGRYGPKVEFDEEPAWKELAEIGLPTFPKAENLKEIYVSAATSNAFMIDMASLSVETDNVVRYVLVVKTSGGATNVSFEGINCKESAWKLYATGRTDGTWTRARAPIEWRPIENKPVNRHHAAISRDLFCPSGLPIKSADDGRNALRLGKHPDAR